MTPRRWAESGLRALDKPGSQSRGQPTPPRGGAGQAGPRSPKEATPPCCMRPLFLFSSISNRFKIFLAHNHIPTP